MDKGIKDKGKKKGGEMGKWGNGEKDTE